MEDDNTLEGENTLDGYFPKEEKRKISRVGLAFFVMLAATAVVTSVLQMLVSYFAPQLAEKNWYIWVLSMLPMYVVGLPLCILLIRRVPKLEFERRDMTFGQFLTAIVMCFGIMYPLSLVGNLLSMLFGALTGGGVNPIEAAVNSSSPLMTLIFAVILGPVLEEILFRGLIVSRLRRYGDKAAIIFSAAVFALYHGNFFQLFYAFGLGLFFAFIYARTGKLRYTIGLHMIVNFIGAFVSSIVTDKLDVDGIQETARSALEGGFGAGDVAQLGGSLGSAALFALYAQILLGLTVAGVILLIVKRRRFVCMPGPVTIPKGRMFNALFLNVGFILFFCACLVMIIVSLFAG
jgi:membrane protease YdiL (CAAX protease family)